MCHPPILFVTAFEAITGGGRQVVGGIKPHQVRGFHHWDDIMDGWHHKHPADNPMHDELLTWRMEIKAAKTRSLSVRKRVPQDKTTFVAEGEPIPRLAEKLLRNPRRHHTADLSNRQMWELAKQQLAHLPEKLKVWCCQHTLSQWVMWPLKICEIPNSGINRMDSLANSYFWSGWALFFRCESFWPEHAEAANEIHQPMVHAV